MNGHINHTPLPQDSLHSLMATLGLANPHFVRCIKPNVQKKQDLFEHQVVLNQLKYSGVCVCLYIYSSIWHFLLLNHGLIIVFGRN